MQDHREKLSSTSSENTEIPRKKMVQPKIVSNKGGTKFNKKENLKMLIDWKLKRVKGQENWKKDFWRKVNGEKKDKKVLSSKYLKFKVSKLFLEIYFVCLFFQIGGKNGLFRECQA